jgi:hypothetical protein
MSVDYRPDPYQPVKAALPARLLQSTIDTGDIAAIAGRVECERDSTDLDDLVLAMIEPGGLGV